MSNEIGDERVEVLELLEMCFDKCFANTIQELCKREAKQGIGKTKALRKTLF